ncbi:hypothetical protein EYF80_037363 [Liparis tanakae]|uniref:Uncharacterized protein n=1 Tax=Liparis tanakae TaxID=230148 RepID=A0A4Z2GHM8_9TELE|nr:hypothetical protein EYF80_037363 [Liparis tanakae]
MLDFKSICWNWLDQPTPKQQLDSLYLCDTSPLVSQKLASPVQGSPVWDSCGSSPHSVAGQPALVCPTKHTHSDRSAVSRPALLDAHLRHPPTARPVNHRVLWSGVSSWSGVNSWSGVSGWSEVRSWSEVSSWSGVSLTSMAMSENFSPASRTTSPSLKMGHSLSLSLWQLLR